MGVRTKIILTISLLHVVSVVNGQNGGTNYKEQEFVDMGLSVFWATYNIGSDSPEGYGEYYAWGETYSKSSYNRMTYRYTNEVYNYISYTKYSGESDVIQSNESKLVLSDDVAHECWGDSWRLPTKSEINELINSCNWTFGELNGTYGCWAVSKLNGNQIFFPFAGYMLDNEVYDVGVSGKYWSSELRPDMCFEAYQLWLSHRNTNESSEEILSVFLSDDGYREYGRTVRAVCDK